MKYIVGVLVLLVGIGMIAGFGAMSDGIKDFRTDWTTDNFVLTTNATTTNGTIQLTNPLWENQTWDTVIASNISSDTPAISGYTQASKNLAFSGLASNTSRLITVQYRTFGLQDYPGADTGVTYIPMALMLGAIFLPLLAIVMILLGR